MHEIRQDALGESSGGFFQGAQVRLAPQVVAKLESIHRVLPAGFGGIRLHPVAAEQESGGRLVLDQGAEDELLKTGGAAGGLAAVEGQSL